VPFARDLHPEFGYIGSAPKLFRKLGLVSAFVAFGLMAGASGIAVFMAGPDPDPMHAMALAPSEALFSTPPGSAPPANAVAAEEQKTLNTGVTPPPCRDYVSERLGDDCSSFRMHRSRQVPAMNERPAIAAVAIGRRDEPAPQPAVNVAAFPEAPADDSAVPADSAEVPAPAAAPATAPVAPAATAARGRSRHVARHEGHSHSGRSSYSPRYYSNRQVHQAGGYARLW
jgi:hypothetical protein